LPRPYGRESADGVSHSARLGAVPSRKVHLLAPTLDPNQHNAPPCLRNTEILGVDGSMCKRVARAAEGAAELPEYAVPLAPGNLGNILKNNAHRTQGPHKGRNCPDQISI